jgi:putative ABC transport system permease protein
MSLWKIAWRNMQQRGLSSTLTGLSMALGVALVVAVLVVYGVIDERFRRAAEGYNLIVGAKGAPLQLVLNTVYHLSKPIENIPWDYYQEFVAPEGRFTKHIDVAIPYCLGDNYEGYRVVGTTPELFSQLGYGVDADGRPRPYAFAEGGNFDPDHFFEGVIGSLVARNTGLTVGSTFMPTHGVTGDEGHKHDPIKVVGVLAPTGTPNDRALFMNIEGFYLLEGHAKEEAKPRKPKPHSHNHDGHAEEGQKDEGQEDEGAGAREHTHAHGEEDADHQHAEEEHAHEHGGEGEQEKHAQDHDGHAHHHHGHSHSHEPLPPELREVTAVLVRIKRTDISAPLALPRIINKGQVAQAVSPIQEIYNLFDGIVGPMKLILLALATLIVVVAGIGIMVSIYNSMSDRRRDIAIMRSLGASRNTVMMVILMESILLSLGGGVGGLLLGHGLIALLNPYIIAQTGVSIGFFQWASYNLVLGGKAIGVPYELILVPGLVILASLVGFLPAMYAYRTDVAKALTAAP